ncbi:MAG: PAS domain S-box protein, partial [Bacteroidota bacterium]
SMIEMRAHSMATPPEAKSVNFYEADLIMRQQDIFQLAMEHAPIGEALLAPDGRWLKVNQALCNILGYTEHELLCMDFQTITHPDDLNSDLELISRLLAGEIETYNLHKRYYHKSKKVIWAQLTVSLVRDEDRRPLYFIKQVQDRTKEHEAEQKLKRAYSELEEFSMKLSHDIRSPLTSSLRVLQLTKLSLADEDVEQAKETVEIVENQIAKLGGLVNDILEIRKLQLTEEKNTSVSLSAIVENALEKFNHMDHFERLAINCDFVYAKPINTKKAAVTSIIENLISNAIKYQDLAEEQSRINIEYFEKDRQIIFQISDNGLGINKRYHERIFRMFQRFHGGEVHGSGLGLYFVKKNTESVGGTVEFIPLEKGSRFRLTIPKG